MSSNLVCQVIFLILLTVFTLYGSWSFLFTVASFFQKSGVIEGDDFKWIGNFKMPIKSPLVSVIVPCKDEEEVIIPTLKALKNQLYPLHQVIIVDDNSQDSTYQLAEGFIKENQLANFQILQRSSIDSNKAKAVNHALKSVYGDVVVFFDADNYPRPDCVGELVRRFQEREVGVVQGRIVSRVHNLLSRIVFMERASGFNVRFTGKELLSLNGQFGGTAVAIRRKLLDDLGGFNEHSLTEDTEITARVIASGYRIVYQPLAMVKEETPPNINNYISQRTRWATGHMNCFLENFKHILSSPIPLKRKLDALMFLFYYFVPVFCGLGLVLGLLTYHFYAHVFLTLGHMGVIVMVLCLTPVMEIMLGTLRSHKKKYVFLIPLMFFFFVLNIFICFNALFNVIQGNKKWVKTERFQVRRSTNRDAIGIIFASLITLVLVSLSFISPLMG